MSKYDVMLKCSQARELMKERKFKDALEIVDGLNIDEINEVMDLRVATEVFIKNKQYDKAKELYYKLYDKLKTRGVLYELIMAVVKSNDFEEAEELYQEFVDKNTSESNQIELRYYIEKGRGADPQTLIGYLTHLKEVNYTEEWGYELAKLYHRLSMEEECVRECSDLILWFGSGLIVEKAMLLKMHYVEGADISTAKGIQETRNLAAELQMAAAIAEERERENAQKNVESLKEIFKNVEVRPDTMDLQSAISEVAKVENAAKTESSEATPQQPQTTEAEYPTDELTESLRQMQAEEEIARSVAAMVDGKIQTEEPSAPSREESSGAMGQESEAGESDFATMLNRSLSSGIMPHFMLLSDSKEASREAASEIAHSLHDAGLLEGTQVAKVSAQKLNTFNLQDKEEQLVGGCLLVEDALAMSIDSIQSIYQLIRRKKKQVSVILTDTEENGRLLLKRNRKMKSLIKNVYEI
ncbi:MAG: hypothetical protein K6G65_05775 [Lachnospiraceae bacterium]|nr:hypothetical protein [Lachnospiraceae bacterium]